MIFVFYIHMHYANNCVKWANYTGKYDKAEELYMGAWKQLKSSRGEDHPDTLAALNQIAGESTRL